MLRAVAVHGDEISGALCRSNLITPLSGVLGRPVASDGLAWIFALE